MGQKIKLSSNIPISLPQKLSESSFGLGFLYPAIGGKGFDLKDGQTWFEKICLSINKVNAIVGFQNSDLKIPEYIAETITTLEKQIENTNLLVRYNAQTKINDWIGAFAPEKNKVSFEDKRAYSLTKGTPMVILGERSLKKMFSQFEEVYGLENKVKFILNHEIAHNIDYSKKYERGNYSIKNIMESYLGSQLTEKNDTMFESSIDLIKTKKMIKQMWTLSLEHYADTLGFLNMRNQLLESGTSANYIHSMLDALIYERKINYKNNVEDYFQKISHSEINMLNFEDRYKCMNHLTVNALSELKEKLQSFGDKVLKNNEIEQIVKEVVNKSDLKALYVLDKLDNTTSELLNKIFQTEVNNSSFIVNGENKKPKFEENVKKLLSEEWIREIGKFLIHKKEHNLYENISILFSSSNEELKELNKKELNNKIKEVRNSSVNHEFNKVEKKII